MFCASTSPTRKPTKEVALFTRMGFSCSTLLYARHTLANQFSSSSASAGWGCSAGAGRDTSAAAEQCGRVGRRPGVRLRSASAQVGASSLLPAGHARRGVARPPAPVQGHSVCRQAVGPQVLPQCFRLQLGRVLAQHRDGAGDQARRGRRPQGPQAQQGRCHGADDHRSRPLAGRLAEQLAGTRRLPSRRSKILGRTACWALNPLAGCPQLSRRCTAGTDPGLPAAVLFGPLQATSYLLNHGLLSAALCTLWTLRAPVLLLMPACAAVRVIGQAGSIVVTSWALRENLFALVVNNLYALLVRELMSPTLTWEQLDRDHQRNSTWCCLHSLACWHADRVR